jgi:hypothetical protein
MRENGRADADDVNATALYQEVIDAVQKRDDTLAGGAQEKEAQRRKDSARQIFDGGLEPARRQVRQGRSAFGPSDPRKNR